ncbi:MAG: GYD domain-containing protein [Chloroflexota bacterium]
MPVYITLIKYTQQGIQNMKDSPSRLEQAKAAIRAAGGVMHAFYLTMGQYDAVSISEAPSDEVYAATMLAIASAGAVSTETLRAFTEDEYREIVAAIP